MTDIPEIWPYLRSLRSDPEACPPEPVERKLVMNASLEQAEQLFKASSMLGRETLPLTLFYGLSQLGRAISATTRLEANWELFGHGISTRDLRGKVADMVVFDKGKNGSFAILSETLGSPTLGRGVRMGDLCATLVELQTMPLDPAAERGGLIIRPGFYTPSGDYSAHPLAVGYGLAEAIIRGIPASLLDGEDPTAQVKSVLQHYPTLRDAVLPSPLYVEKLPNNRMDLRLAWVVDSSLSSNPAARRQYIFEKGHNYRFKNDYTVAYPAFEDATIHPFMVWWAILFGLSMLARYEPAAWVRALNVDSSTEAVALEYLLNQAKVAVPEAAYRLIGEHTGWK
ncbi:YaaC family protein [Kribbella sp. CA-294648]|uniref:YaaC family protein n=1 Tax=Kribbella sp. CA-294648 TaxID=3239948 RepID=UPI003D8AA950